MQPRQPSDVVAILKHANQQRISLSVRGRGRSQSGQSLSPEGLVVETRHLNQMEYGLSQPQRIRCGAGVTWRQLVEHCAPQGYLPYVMPLNLDLTVGGTLSVGGVGANSHRFGPAIAHVDALEVITGAGDWVACSADTELDLFHGVLAGLGRCGMITAATLPLRPIQPLVRTYYLLYEEIQPWLNDQRHLAQRAGITYLEGFCAASIQGLHKTSAGRRPLRHWQYGLHLSVEFSEHQPPDDSILLDNLQFSKLLLAEEDETAAFAARYDARFQAMRQSGAWQQAHPWFECLLPFDQAAEVISDVLKDLPLCFGEGHRTLMLAENPVPKLFMTPEASPAIVFAILPTAIPEAVLPTAIAALTELNQRVIQAGGKRYCSGWLGPMTDQSWRTHYGSQFQYWQTVKQVYDPNTALRSVLFP